MTKDYEFDPGFGNLVLAFPETINYLYMDIKKFKNFSQRKMRFKQFYKKMLDMFYNNLGFYIGCLFWAFYIKSQPEGQIINNPCFGKSFNEKEDTSGPDFLISFLDLFPKDMAYFADETFYFDEKYLKIAETYREFLLINHGFTECKKNTDIKLPKNITVSDTETAKKLIDEAISDGNLAKLTDSKDLLFKN